tara:strand:+ start:353 stop:988 length:636 start_codon:yes stop_codon:yes gene_type:complete
MAYKQKGFTPFNKTKQYVGDEKIIKPTGIPTYIDSPLNKNKKLKKAKKDLRSQKNIYASLDTSNPYDDIVNPFEDLSVNERESDLYNQMFQQNQANILSSSRESAGSSGAAGLTAALAEESKRASQVSSNLIGKKEGENQLVNKQFESYMQTKKAEGETWSRNANKEKQATLLGISQNELAAQREKIAASKQIKWDVASKGIDTIGHIASS